MADDVHFLGSAGTSTVTVVGNGFPLQFVTRADADIPERFPTVSAVVFGDIIEMFWRIKEWTLTNDFNVSEGAFSTTLPDGAIPLFPGLVIRENELTTAANLLFFRPASGSVSDLFVDLFTTDGLSVGGFGIAFDDPNYYPALRVHGTLVAGSSAIEFDTLPLAMLPDTTLSTLAAVILGQTFILNIRDDDPLGTGSFTHSTFILTPSKYWPYAASDGTPIWNTGTGVQLQDENN